MKQKLVSADAAARLVSSGSTVSVCGISGGITPDKVMKALGRRYAETGKPGDLKMVLPVAVGDGYDILGLEHLAIEGMISEIIAGSFTIARSTEKPPRIYEMIISNKVRAYNIPIGTLMQLHREIAARRPGIITEVGLGTFLDPRQEGGRMNAVTTEDLVQVITLNGKEYLFYPAFPIDVAIVRGTTADEDGNVTMEQEFTLSAVLAMAMAAHNCGGTVIDTVMWDDGATMPDLTGAAMQLHIDHYDAAENDLPGWWCAAETVYGDGDLGTPKADNIACPDPCEGVVCDTVPDPDCDGDVAQTWDLPGTCVAGICEYTLVATEDCAAQRTALSARKKCSL